MNARPLAVQIQQQKHQDMGNRELLNLLLVGGFKYFLFSPLFGEDSHFD